MNRTLKILAAISAAIYFGALQLPNAVADGVRSRPAVTFAFFGCNRIDGPDWLAARSQNPSSANIPQLTQNLKDIAALSPDLVFFGGDLVMGYADDRGETLKSQMSAWVDLVKSLPHAAKSQYIAITGNHELNRKVGDQKLPSPGMDPVWSSIVRTAHLLPEHATGPTPESSREDDLVSDQRALSFTFERAPARFIVLNTDTRVSTKDPDTGETRIAMIPARWLDRQLDAAERDPAVKCVIILGHRNLVTPETAKGDAPIDPQCASAMVKSVVSHSKVRAYVCAHVHAYDVTTIGRSGAKQVVFGNGGSKLEKDWHPAGGRTFGFGYFQIFNDGSVSVTPYFRPAPDNYMASGGALVPAAKPQPEIIIPAR